MNTVVTISLFIVLLAWEAIKALWYVPVLIYFLMSAVASLLATIYQDVGKTGEESNELLESHQLDKKSILEKTLAWSLLVLIFGMINAFFTNS